MDLNENKIILLKQFLEIKPPLCYLEMYKMSQNRSNITRKVRGMVCCGGFKSAMM